MPVLKLSLRNRSAHAVWKPLHTQTWTCRYDRILLHSSTKNINMYIPVRQHLEGYQT